MRCASYGAFSCTARRYIHVEMMRVFYGNKGAKAEFLLFGPRLGCGWGASSFRIGSLGRRKMRARARGCTAGEYEMCD